MKIIVLLLFLGMGLQVVGTDAPTVPNTIHFAGLNLKLSDKARKKIQAEVNALTRYPKYQQIKIDRLQIYFPIIERIFMEEGLPEDFKYLVLQESALISDAVSTSNAVGFWQFKRDAGTEVGLRIDRNVDERLNIVSSTRGAAKYLKKNNRVFFDNWIHALLAYQQGPTGALKLVKKKYKGTKSMPIDSHTHWYVIKFLAHKIAFEQVKPADPKLYLMEYYGGQGKNLKEISNLKHLDFDLIQKYNKWLKRGDVPKDKPYAVILPYDQNPGEQVAVASKKARSSASGAKRSSFPAGKYRTHPEKYPTIYSYKNRRKGIKINGIKGVRLKEDMSLAALVRSSGVSIKQLLYYNDVNKQKKPRSGELWYLKSKRSKAMEEYHVVEEGEDLWSVSQRYGIKLAQLNKKNRISKRQTKVRAGRVLWLRSTRPVGEPVAYKFDDTPGNKEHSTTNSEGYKFSSKQKTVKQQGKVQPSSQKTKSIAIYKDISQKGVSKSAMVNQPEKLILAEQKVHVVQSGETLYSISKEYGVTIDELKGWNNLNKAGLLSISQQLLIPEVEQSQKVHTIPTEAPEAKILLHRVKPGETLYQIARDYNATIKQLMEWNKKSDFNLSPGEELRIYRSP